MSYSQTITDTTTFTRTHARHLAAKVATDLKRMQRFYGQPTDSHIVDLEDELVELLKGGYLERVTYGFRRNGRWITPTLRYTAHDLVNTSANDDDPGRIRPGAYIGNSSFYSYLSLNRSWHNLSVEEQQIFEKRLPFPRTGAPEPDINGRWVNDLTYSSGGRALNRAIVRG